MTAHVPSRIRLRRKLFAFSAPVIVVAVVAAVKMITVVIAGNAAVSDFARHDADALRDDVSALAFINVIEPDKVEFARADADALQGDLDEADARFTGILTRLDAAQSCPVRVNLELVRETHGDGSARGGDLGKARQRYTSALAVIREAPAGCFAGNDDPDPDRRAIRNDAEARLIQKLAALDVAPPAPPPPPPSPPAPPPPPPGAPEAGRGGLDELNADRLPGSGPLPELRLDPGAGNPLDRLQQALADADAAAPDGQ